MEMVPVRALSAAAVLARDIRRMRAGELAVLASPAALAELARRKAYVNWLITFLGYDPETAHEFARTAGIPYAWEANRD